MCRRASPAPWAPPPPPSRSSSNRLGCGRWGAVPRRYRTGIGQAALADPFPRRTRRRGPRFTITWVRLGHLDAALPCRINPEGGWRVIHIASGEQCRPSAEPAGNLDAATDRPPVRRAVGTPSNFGTLRQRAKDGQPCPTRPIAPRCTAYRLTSSGTRFNAPPVAISRPWASCMTRTSSRCSASASPVSATRRMRRT